VPYTDFSKSVHFWTNEHCILQHIDQLRFDSGFNRAKARIQGQPEEELLSSNYLVDLFMLNLFSLDSRVDSLLYQTFKASLS